MKKWKIILYGLLLSVLFSVQSLCIFGGNTASATSGSYYIDSVRIDFGGINSYYNITNWNSNGRSNVIYGIQNTDYSITKITFKANDFNDNNGIEEVGQHIIIQFDIRVQSQNQSEMIFGCPKRVSQNNLIVYDCDVNQTYIRNSDDTQWIYNGSYKIDIKYIDNVESNTNYVIEMLGPFISYNTTLSGNIQFQISRPVLTLYVENNSATNAIEQQNTTYTNESTNYSTNETTANSNILSGQTDINNGGQNLIGILTGFKTNVLDQINQNSTDCNLNLGNPYNFNMGTIDLCYYNPPNWLKNLLNVVASLAIVGLAITVFWKIINIIKGFTK